MTSRLHHLRRAVKGLVAEDRPSFKRLDASPVRYDDGSWLTPRHEVLILSRLATGADTGAGGVPSDQRPPERSSSSQ
jgi:hypothetical protein